MQNIHDTLEQIIDNLLLIKNNSDRISSIEKDILLQNLREAYLLILRQPVMDESQVVENQEEKSEEVQDNLAEEAVVEENEAIQEEEQTAEENEEMDTDILEFVKVFEDTSFEAKTPTKPERDLFTEADDKPVEPEPELELELEPVKTTEPKPVENPAAEPEVVSHPEPEEISQPEPEIVSQPVSEDASKPEPVEITAPEPEVVSHSEPEVVSQPEPEIVPQPTSEVVSKPEPEKIQAPEPEVVSHPEPEVISQSEPEIVLHPEPKVTPQPQTQPQAQTQPEVKPEQRSLNDLFNEQKQDLGEKFQQTKITDLTKAMSINDKFLFIRELFKNKSEEFSHAIHTLNNCENIEEAFDIMEGLKKQYFWDSTSSAYLALCDLVRRKF